MNCEKQDISLMYGCKIHLNLFFWIDSEIKSHIFKNDSCFPKKIM